MFKRGIENKDDNCENNLFLYVFWKYIIFVSNLKFKIGKISNYWRESTIRLQIIRIR